MNTLCQLFLTLHIIGTNRTITTLSTNFWWPWQTTHMSNIQWNINPTRFSPPTLIKYRDRLLYPDSYIHNTIILEAWMVMPSLKWTPRPSSKEKIDSFHIIITRLQQEINIRGEPASPTRLIIQYTKSLSKSDKLKVFIAPNMKYLIILIENNGKLAICTGGNIHVIYHYLDIIGAPTNLTSFGHRYHPYINSSSTKNNKASPQTFIAALCII